MNNLDLPEGRFCYSMIQNAAKFDEKFYDWYDWIERDSTRITDYLENNSGNNFVYIEFSYKELGKDEKWFKNQVRELEGDMLLVKREILLQWTYASNVSPFSEEQLTTLEQYASANEIFKKIYMENYIIQVITMPKNMYAKNWIMSIDVGGGLGIDGSAFTIIDPASMLPVMIFNNNTISIPDFADLIERFVNEYIPNAIIIPERNNAGIALIQILQKSSVSNNLYYEIREKKAEKTVENKSLFKISKNAKVKKEVRVYGINTNITTRDIMINQILFMIVNEKPYLINNKELFSEIRTLYRNPRGKIEHSQGFHDDLLFSYLIGLYPLLYSNSINKFLKNISDLTDDKVKNKKSEIITKRILSMNNTINNEENLTDKIINDFSRNIENNDELKHKSLSNKNLNDKISKIIDLNK